MDSIYQELETQYESSPQVFYPWRRYFARMIDILMYNMLWTLFCIFVGGIQIKNYTMIGISIGRVVVLLLTLLIEPILLSTMGTTIGKAVLGLKIRNRDGRPLSYDQALERTRAVCLKGLGLCIPGLDVYRLGKSYGICNENQTLSWDENLSYTMKDKKTYRILLVIVSFIIVFMIQFTSILSQQLPPNRGELTKEEFAENLNYYAKYLDIQFGQYYFKDDGKWYQKPSEYESEVDKNKAMSQFIYTMDGDHISAIAFTIEIKDSMDYISSYNSYMIAAGLAFAGAQTDVGIFSNITKRIEENIQENTFKDFQFMEAGIKFTCETSSTGYYMGTVLVPMEGNEEYHYSLRFQMEKVE